MTAASTNQFPEVLAQRVQESPADLLHWYITDAEIHWRLLSLLEQNPSWTQRLIAEALGVGLCKFNCCLCALKDKGLVGRDNFSQNPKKLQHMRSLTPKGIAQKAQLTAHFLQRKERELKKLRCEITLKREIAPMGQAA